MWEILMWKVIVAFLWLLWAVLVLAFLAAAVTVIRMAWEFGLWLARKLQLWWELRRMSSR